jgi:hypothetical protein
MLLQKYVFFFMITIPSPLVGVLLYLLFKKQYSNYFLSILLPFLQLPQHIMKNHIKIQRLQVAAAAHEIPVALKAV